jgi:hypothetical protein
MLSTAYGDGRRQTGLGRLRLNSLRKKVAWIPEGSFGGELLRAATGTRRRAILNCGYDKIAATATITEPKVTPTPSEKATVADNILNIPKCISCALIFPSPPRHSLPLTVQ